MTRASSKVPVAISQAAARRLWLRCQRLDSDAPFGTGLEATARAVAHLGYVQIDTINVIERCHHHILATRIPGYRRVDLVHAQSTEKSVFEYWTHALAYIPSSDYRYYVAAMRRWRPSPWYAGVTPRDISRMLARIRDNGPLTMRDIDDGERVEKNHAWASRKPEKRILQCAFYRGDLVIAARTGMLKTYEITDRHFGWDTKPKSASDREIATYVLDRALRAQGAVSLDSICHLDAPRKGTVRSLIAQRVRAKSLVPLAIEGHPSVEHWARPEDLVDLPPMDETRIHILSPFDPLIIQRKRLQRLFDFTYLFEAYVPKEKRKLGYFALPILAGDRIVAAIDLKTDRQAGKLLVQQWTWVEKKRPADLKRRIERALDTFGTFQLAATKPAAAVA